MGQVCNAFSCCHNKSDNEGEIIMHNDELSCNDQGGPFTSSKKMQFELESIIKIQSQWRGHQVRLSVRNRNPDNANLTHIN